MSWQNAEGAFVGPLYTHGNNRPFRVAQSVPQPRLTPFEAQHPWGKTFGRTQQLLEVAFQAIPSWASGDVAGIALDADAYTVALYKNGVRIGLWSYEDWSGADGKLYFSGGFESTTNHFPGAAEQTYVWNFGQNPSFGSRDTSALAASGS